MKTSLIIPDKIKVGYQKRNDTYTQKLAYVIYYDHKGKLRKEASWESWRDDSIPSDEFENVPTEGFVLNKKAGGYSTGWNHRQTFCRVYDSRGFEFEIDIPNLLYILESNDSIKGKGLTGEYVYAWDGTSLVLLPVDSPDYKQIKEFNTVLKDKNYIKVKDLKIGFQYRTKTDEAWIYMGRFDFYEEDWRNRGEVKNKGKRHFFQQEYETYDGNKAYYFKALTSLGDKFIECISDSPVENFAEIMEKLEKNTSYSPYDPSKDEYKNYTWEEILKLKNESRTWGFDLNFYDQNKKIYTISQKWINGEYIEQYEVKPYIQDRYLWGANTVKLIGNLQEVFHQHKPMYKNKYLQNGKLYRTHVCESR